MSVREFQFVVGPETSAIPTATDPVLDSDIVILGWLEGKGFTRDTIHSPAVTVAAAKAVIADERVDNMVMFVDELTKWFYFDSASGATGNDVTILTPDAGTGRWIAIGGGAGGGSVIKWNENGPNAPVRDIENNIDVYLFQDVLAQEVYAGLKVPESYEAGSQIKMFVSSFSPSSSNTQLFSALTTLIRKGADPVTDTTNQHTSTNGAITNDQADELTVHEIDLSNPSGLINSVAVSAGDLLNIKLFRATATDTDTADVRMLVDGSEPKFS